MPLIRHRCVIGYSDRDDLVEKLMERTMPPELQINSIAAVVPHPDGQKIVLKAEALIADQRTQLGIAITTDLAPAMALALLASTAQARAERDALSPAFDALAAAVVQSGSPDKVRLQLLFNKGAVLPIEMNADAGLALSGGLVEYFSVKQRRYAPRKNSGAAAG